MKFDANILGHNLSVQPKEQQQEQPEPYKSPINTTFISKLSETLMRYAAGKQHLEAKIIENERWFKSQHWDIIRQKGANKDDPEPVTAYLFSTIANKHADAMDYYPEPNILPRQEADEEEGTNLTSIIPIELELRDFYKTYSDAWWYKLKHGTAAYGMFFNPELDGIGGIDIQKLDLLNIYWEPGITDIQKSRRLFIISLIDDEVIEEMYPETVGKLGGDNRILNPKQYFTDDTIDIQGKSIVVDCYYKKNVDGKTVVHMTKFVDHISLASTEDDEEQVGLYAHGKYPVEFDVLFPEEGSPCGFGFIDILKNPQMYIDKLDQSISKNAIVSGKVRMIVKDNNNIDPADLADLSKEVIMSKGGCREGEDFAMLQGKPMASFIPQHRQGKILELKEVGGNRDFQQGGTTGGVTAMGAIQALQEAGNKLSRDMIGDSYNSYARMIYMCIELVRQFYDEDRDYRTTDEEGNSKYVTYNNRGLQPQALPPSYDGEGMTQDPETGEMIPDPEYQPKQRRAEFSVKVKPQRASPFAKAAQNEMGTAMFNMGFFNPQRAVEAKLALELMMFEGKDKVLKMIGENGDLFVQLQQAQMQLQQMQQLVGGMNEIVKRTTGRDMMQPQAVQPQIGGVINNG